MFLKGGLFVFHLLVSIAPTWSMYTFAKFNKNLSTHLSSHPLYNQHVRVVSHNGKRGGKISLRQIDKKFTPIGVSLLLQKKTNIERVWKLLIEKKIFRLSISIGLFYSFLPIILIALVVCTDVKLSSEITYRRFAIHTYLKFVD